MCMHSFTIKHTQKRLHPPTHLFCQQQWILPDGSEYVVPQFPVGYAAKKRKQKVILSVEVRHYLEWAFSLGEKNKDLKLKPQTAASHMRLHGTLLGQQNYSGSRFGSWVDIVNI